ncbi:unnamed protein product [Merluccius merluccius]
MAICAHCQPTYRLLQENITRLKQDIKSKDDLILSFSTVATSQAKRLAQFSSSSYYGQSVGCPAAVHGDATLPWSGSATAGGESIISTEAHAPTDDNWPALGAKPKTRACSTPYDPEPWIQVRSSKGRARRSLHLRSSDTLPLKNSFQVLDDRDGNSPDDPTKDIIAKPAIPAKGSAYATAAAVVQPPPVFGATDALTADPRALSRRFTEVHVERAPALPAVHPANPSGESAIRAGRRLLHGPACGCERRPDPLLSRCQREGNIVHSCAGDPQSRLCHNSNCPSWK